MVLARSGRVCMPGIAEGVYHRCRGAGRKGKMGVGRVVAMDIWQLKPQRCNRHKGRKHQIAHYLYVHVVHL